METSKFHRVGPGGPYEYCHEKLMMNFHGNFMGKNLVVYNVWANILYVQKFHCTLQKI